MGNALFKRKCMGGIDATSFLGAALHRIGAICGLFVLTALTLPACSKPETAEQRVRTLIASAELAAEGKNIGELRGYVSDSYSDPQGRDRRTIDGILRLYLLRHGKVHLLTRIHSVELPEPGYADAVVYVAMAARPIVSAAELGAFRADLYRFEIRFIDEDGEWRLARAAWRPANPADFIYQASD